MTEHERTEFEHIIEKARMAKNGSFGVLSTGEKLAVAKRQSFDHPAPNKLTDSATEIDHQHHPK